MDVKVWPIVREAIPFSSPFLRGWEAIDVRPRSHGAVDWIVGEVKWGCVGCGEGEFALCWRDPRVWMQTLGGLGVASRYAEDGEVKCRLSDIVVLSVLFVEWTVV